MSELTSRWRHRLLHRALPLTLVVGGVVLLHQAASNPSLSITQSPTLALGILLIGGYIFGRAAAAVSLPRITGYLLLGVAVGPFLTGILTKEMLAAGEAVEGVAVALIALTAGGELRVAWVRRFAKRLTVITLTQIAIVGVAVFAVVMLLRGLFPFIPDDLATAAVIAMVFGAIAVSNSPMVTVAVIAETRSEGPLSRTALGVTVLVDVSVIILFAIALTLAKDALGQSEGGSLGGTLTRELGGSILVGWLFGLGISGFLRFVGRDVAVFVLAACLAMWGVASALHLETLLVALTAGFWVENFSSAKGDDLIKGIERLSLPVFALFFAAAGTKVDLDALATLWPLALLLSAVRATGMWGASQLATRWTHAEPAVARYLWLGLISQAGMTLALATIVARNFPGWGDEVQALIVAMIALHELVGPIGFQWALGKAGEIGRAGGLGGEELGDGGEVVKVAELVKSEIAPDKPRGY